jgi:hypothetical protein
MTHSQHAQPAQAAGLDEMAPAGTNRITIDPFRRDAGAAPALDGVVEPNHHRAVWGEGGDQQQQEPMRQGPRAPVPVAQHAMLDGEAGSFAQTHDA